MDARADRRGPGEVHWGAGHRVQPPVGISDSSIGAIRVSQKS
jgi:hypothetical protein